MHRSRSTNAVRLAALSLLVAGSACAYTPRPSVHDQIAIALDSAGRDTAALHGPAVTISTDSDYGRYRRVVTRIRADEDAYVIVVNVSPAGYAQVVYPEDPRDDAMLVAGKSYILPSQFVGHAWELLAPSGALGKRFVWYGRSEYARVAASGPGYLFVVASRLPLNLEALEIAGYFDGLEMGTALRDMDPDAVIPPVALLAVGFSARGGVGIDVARYSGYDAGAYAMAGYQSAYGTASSMYSHCGAGYRLFGPTPVTAWDPTFLGPGCSAYDLYRLRESGRILPPRINWPPSTPDSVIRPPHHRVKPGVPASDTVVAATYRAGRTDVTVAPQAERGSTWRETDVTDEGDIVVLRRGRRDFDARMRERTNEPGVAPRQRGERPAAGAYVPRRRTTDERASAPERPRAVERPQSGDGVPRAVEGGSRPPAPVERAPAPEPRSRPVAADPSPGQPSPTSPAPAQPERTART